MGSEPVKQVRVLAPSGMLGAGWDHATIERGIALGADVISIDAGSTDSGPYYLGSSTPKTTAEAVARDLRSLLTAAAGAGIPVIVGSCGTSGTDSGVDWVAGIAAEVMAREGLSLKVARVYSEQSAAELKEHLDAGRIHPLPRWGRCGPRPSRAAPTSSARWGTSRSSRHCAPAPRSCSPAGPPTRPWPPPTRS
ncbi:hypothetical protein [[Actinomadura] parvosata]|uniref:hypothetical protein n=1 Tax=[Actinomadura] parvosata TaxID=1955412 RepID=UPI001E444FC9|nr:hypothetical protein [Nonomuraea sp. ATCC 55076]